LSQEEVVWGHHAMQDDRATPGNKETRGSNVARGHRAVWHDRATLVNPG